MRVALVAGFVVVLGCGTMPSSGTGGGSALGGGAGGAIGGGSGGAAGGLGGSGGAGSSGGGTGGSLDAGPGLVTADGGTNDRDLDGLDDAWEHQIATGYAPILAKHPQDGCPLSAIAYRVRRHPSNPNLLAIVYDQLFQDDCGLTSHPGDNEGFGITVNPSKPAPEGITAVKAISHQNTACQKVTECGACNGLPACAAQPDGGTRPQLFSSKDKHGGYAILATCNSVLSCLDQCAAGVSATVPMVNVGEPNAPLTRDLTDAGLITAANGWTKPQFFNFDPWDATKKFGGAGTVAEDFVDPAFVANACP